MRCFRNVLFVSLMVASMATKTLLAKRIRVSELLKTVAVTCGA
jgi:hypothetical protein